MRTHALFPVAGGGEDAQVRPAGCSGRLWYPGMCLAASVLPDARCRINVDWAIHDVCPRLCVQSLQLLGFVPSRCVAPWTTRAPPSVVAPRKHGAAACTALSALSRAMRARDQVAIVRHLNRTTHSLAVCALVPHPERDHFLVLKPQASVEWVNTCVPDGMPGASASLPWSRSRIFQLLHTFPWYHNEALPTALCPGSPIPPPLCPQLFAEDHRGYLFPSFASLPEVHKPTKSDLETADALIGDMTWPRGQTLSSRFPNPAVRGAAGLLTRPRIVPRKDSSLPHGC